jgi:hypothetical protein
MNESRLPLHQVSQFATDCVESLVSFSVISNFRNRVMDTLQVMFIQSLDFTDFFPQLSYNFSGVPAIHSRNDTCKLRAESSRLRRTMQKPVEPRQ